ncbi:MULTISPECIES: efflux RND transporter permease subunit [Asticcacaulis]|uniref:efflux RND transporter permease subunit n=1 Tax=Asticcacaulis TaxID=76890 RepID=UPI001AE229BE|nr:MULTISPECIES: efflux RND transporter permease subunit [Asticcacaulis]MBP2160422.1 CzcA family heavy metal efflux pump [Asticcacaulis solisilvae]MDR6801467.1 CzcA family heavy metal efflux pump [Asticcacaulis sp. BE141]
MLNWLVTNALRQRVLVLALAVVFLVVGLRAIPQTDLDVFPEFAPPMVEIQTEAPGMSTEEVESLVTVPLETAINGVSGLKTLRSKSVLGLSSVVVILKEGTDVIRARQLVQERVSLVATRLPSSVRPPVMLPPLSATSRAMKIGMSSKMMDQMAMSDIVRMTVRPKLMAVPGVANVAVWGQRDRQLQVLVDPARLAEAGVTVAEVQRAAGDAALVGGGGFIDTPNQRLAVRHLSAAETPAALALTVVKLSNGAPIRIGDVATVTEGHAAPIGDAIINDVPGLLLIVEKQQGGNTLDVTRGVEAALADLKPALTGIDVDSTIFRPATFIERSIHNLTQALWLGCALVAGVLILFTRDWRAAVISLTAIPLSLLGATYVLSLTGQGLNTMVIAGLVIALGEIVDDAIIDVENIGRRLRLNRQLETPKPAFDVVLAASLEVRTAVVFASLIVMLVFLPVFFMGGVSGSFFRPLATAYILAIASSLLIALTLTPALCLLLMPKSSGEKTEPAMVRGLKHAYRGFLPVMVGRPKLAMGLIAAGLSVAAIGYVTTKDQFLPNFRETDFLMHFVEKPGTSVEAMDRITIQASKELRSIEGVRNFGSHIGRAEAGDEVYGPNFTELWISLDEKADYDASVKKIQEAIDGYPGLYRDVLTYLRERIKEVLTGAGASVVVRIYGPDMETLRAKAAEVKAAVAGIQGVADLKVEQQKLIPQIQIRPKPETMAAYGLSAGDIRRAANTLVAGSKVGEIFRNQMSVDVTVWGTAETRSDVHALRDAMIAAPGGGQVRLGDVADVLVMPAANEIKRENGSRRIDVTLNISGSDLGTVARAVEAKVSKMKFAPGYHPEFLGEYAALQQSKRDLMIMGGFCLLGVLLLIWLEFRSIRLTALIGLSLPFALLGGVIAVILSGGVMSLGSLVGFVTVLGISARNGIMLISHYQHLEHREGEAFGPRLILRGAEERLVPILMTASCAALALLPLIVNGDAPGHEIEHPMALVILGGLISSTTLNLLLMPALYARFGRHLKPAQGQEVTA